VRKSPTVIPQRLPFSVLRVLILESQSLVVDKGRMCPGQKASAHRMDGASGMFLGCPSVCA